MEKFRVGTDDIRDRTEARDIFAITVPCGAKGARQARIALKIAMIRASIPKAHQNGLLLATAEWITNLGQHPETQPEEVDVCLVRIGSAYVFEMTDNGSPFTSFEQAAWNETPPLYLSDCGMGVRMIAHYFPIMTYTISKHVNRLRLQCYLSEVVGKPSILMVDDDPVVRKLYGEFLNGAYQTFLADGADEALQILGRTSVDLIISDIVMPNGASGLELCTRIRQDKSLETVPFIFLTGETSNKTRKEAQGLAIDDYLIKPVRKAALLSCAERVILNAQFIRNRLGDRFDESLTRLLHPALANRLGNYNAVVHSRSAEAGGGDLLFHRRIGDNTIIVLADLMGHGSQAKFFSHALAGYLSGMLAALEILSPNAVLEKLNHCFGTDPLLTQTVATAMAVQISDNGIVQIANAGQPEPFLIDQSGNSRVPISGPLLGLNLESVYESYQLNLKHKQRLCLHTDGLSELGNTPESHSHNYAAITALFEETLHLPMDSAAHHVEQFIDQLLTEELSDDLTFIMLEYAD